MLIAFISIVLSQTATAVPASSYEVIKALFENEEFKEMIHGQKKGWDYASLKAIKMLWGEENDEARKYCQDTWSFSGSAVKVTFALGSDRPNREFVFTTSWKPEDLSLCYEIGNPPEPLNQ